MMNRSELFAEGRHSFYEGDNPKAFVKEMKEKFGFDPSKDNDSWTEKMAISFFASLIVWMRFMGTAGIRSEASCLRCPAESA
jgi:hypothetical protein